MSRILVVYGTTEGQTAKIAQSLGDALREEGASADVANAGAAWPDPRPYDAVIVAASIHVGGYQRAVRRWVRAHADVLNEKPSAFVSVCLAVLQSEAKVQQELSAIVDRFLKKTGWRPSTTKHVAGALAYTQYNWLTRIAMVRIARKAGGDTDTSRDHEYTDWADVRAFAGAFARSLPARPIASEVRRAAA
jgi:menaquinone-dependent protoporphyrinogen oxidase